METRSIVSAMVAKAVLRGALRAEQELRVDQENKQKEENIVRDIVAGIVQRAAVQEVHDLQMQLLETNRELRTKTDELKQAVRTQLCCRMTSLNTCAQLLGLRFKEHLRYAFHAVLSKKTVAQEVAAMYHSTVFVLQHISRCRTAKNEVLHSMGR